MDNIQYRMGSIRAMIGERVGALEQVIGDRLDGIEERMRELRLDRWEKCRKHLPEGSGPYSVGCMDIMSDHTVQGTYIRLYYPIEKRQIHKYQMLWPLWLPRKQYGKGYAYFKRKNLKLYGKFINWVAGDTYVPVIWQAPMSRDKKFPAIVFSHGLGGNRTSNTTICTDWASHGNIVAAIEHRDGSASMTLTFKEFFNGKNNTQPDTTNNTETNNTSNTDSCSGKRKQERLHRDHSFTENWLYYERQENEIDYHIRNKQVHVRALECMRVLNLLEAMHLGDPDVHNVLGSHFDIMQFKGCFDLNQVGVAGHSFGGSTTIATLSKDKRFKFGVSLDGWMLPLEKDLYEKVLQPVLFVNMETFQWKSNVLDMMRLVDMNSSNRSIITIRGTCHQSVTDFQFIVNTAFGKFIGVRNTLDPNVAMDLVNRASLAFMAKCLGRDDSEHDAGEILEGNHEHVIRGTNLNL